MIFADTVVLVCGESSDTRLNFYLLSLQLIMLQKVETKTNKDAYSGRQTQPGMLEQEHKTKPGRELIALEF